VSRIVLPDMAVGNEFITRPKKLQAAVNTAAAVSDLVVLDDMAFELEAPRRASQPVFGRLMDWLHRYSLGVFALLFLLIAASAVWVGSLYWSAHITLAETPLATALHVPAKPLRGPNAVVMKQPAIGKSLSEAAAPYMRAPINQVTASYSDGTSKVIATGKNGLKLTDTTALTAQIADGLLGAKGFQLTLPTESQAFASVTPASFDKLIEVNVVSKQMYLYDKGQLAKTYPISAGAPATPTPIGQFKIYQKLAIQDMRGFNANGSKYFQPHVHWINYFLPGGYAVHGNYWRPLSWFGAVNSSHGCVSLPDDQAKEVYDWAPIGTTVITHY
jgi:lipoprotein-anchoring transpeptidase ErfK/SrfK